MKKTIATTFVIMIFQLMLVGQDCGTPNLESIKSQMLENRIEISDNMLSGLFRNEEPYYLPLNIYAVAESNGTGRAKLKTILQMICTLNDVYKNQGIQFYLNELNNIDNSIIYSSASTSSGRFQINIIRKFNGINVFIADKAGESSTIAFYLPPARVNDYIVIRKGFLTDRRILAHEIGHYLSVPHPFHGWDEEPWDPQKHGNPVGNLAPDNRTVNEFANGSNCDSTLSQGANNVGDGICDTPADYNFLNSRCEYDKNAMDPTGIEVTPMTDNVMNYFSGCSDYYFTPGQNREMLRSYLSSSRTYIRDGYEPVTTEITEDLNLIFPTNGETTSEYLNVDLAWASVTGAQKYMVIVDISPSLDFDPMYFITSNNSFTVTDLLPNKNYFWQVIPYNEYYTCSFGSSTWRFKTASSTSTNDIFFLQNFTLYPNPNQGNTVYLKIQSERPFDGQVEIIGSSGQKLMTVSDLKFNAGENTIDLNIQPLANGINFTKLVTKHGIAYCKFSKF